MISTLRYLLLSYVILLASAPRAEENQSFSLAQTKLFHQQFDFPFRVWGRGGDFTRYVFLNMTQFWPHILLSRDGQIKQVPFRVNHKISSFVLPFDRPGTRFGEFVRNAPVDGVVILHKGRIVFEDYPRMAPTDKHAWFSISKTIVSTAIAILEDRGKVNVSTPVDHYLTELRGSAWGGTPVRDILDMASGIDCLEVKSESTNCFWTFYDAFGWPLVGREHGKAMDALRSMQRLRSPGEVFQYTSVNTEVLTCLLPLTLRFRRHRFPYRPMENSGSCTNFT